MTRAERQRRKSFWFRVQLRCDALGLSHNAFGRRVGVTTGPVSEWFALLRMPRGEYLLRFPAVLKCDGHWLLTGEGSARQRHYG